MGRKERGLGRLFTAYARVVTARGVKAAVGAGLIAYWALSAYGFSQMAVEMSPEKTILDDSPLMPFFRNILPFPSFSYALPHVL